MLRTTPFALLLPLLARGYVLPSAPHMVTSTRSRAANMFFESEKKAEKKTTAEVETTDFEVKSIKNHNREVTERTGCSVVVTEGTGNFYDSRALVQMLHDFGNHKSIVALSDSAATAKKALLTRKARYSGLIDTLSFTEGSLAAADAWLAINADEGTMPTQIEEAKAVGITRVFVLLTGSGPTDCPSPAMESMLEESGLKYTVMRTGNLVDDAPPGGGLVLGEVDLAVCGDVSKEDVYRFVTEALTLPEAEARAFSLCPSDATTDSLRQMRLCGYERRAEVKALLDGLISPAEAASELSEEEAAEEAELVLRSEAEVAEEREKELKMLLARARERGIATQAKMKYEEEERLKVREEMSKYYEAPPSKDTLDALEEAMKDASATPPIDKTDETKPPEQSE